MASQVTYIDRTAANISTLVHENYYNEVKPWLDHLDPVAAVFESIGDDGYSLIGEKLQFGADAQFQMQFMGTDGYLPDHTGFDPVEPSTTPARLYKRTAADNFLLALAVRPGAYEDFFARLNFQMLDSVKRGTGFHVHGSKEAKVCTFVSRTSATVLVVDAGYNHASTSPTMFVDDGVVMALTDANMSDATIGTAAVSSVAHNTSPTTATVTFATDIDTSSTGADGDPLVFSTSVSSSANNYVTEQDNAPNGLGDIIDADANNTTFMGVSESTYARWTPHRLASSDFGHIELMEFMEQIAARSNSEVTAGSHIMTCQNGVKIELAKDLLAYQSQYELGRTLRGGWQTVMIGEHELITSHYHWHDVLYCLCPEELHVVDLDGEPSVWSGDGSQFNRIADYDGKEWFLRHYVQRFCSRRNNMGALTGITNTNAQRYAALPEAA